MNKRKPPFWLLPNLLSLDAPVVAIVWMWMLAHSMRVTYVDAASFILLPAAVWVVYVADRIRDVKRGMHPIKGEMPWRHSFHWKYRVPLLLFMALFVIIALYASVVYLPVAVCSAGVVGCVLVLIYGFISRFQITGQVPFGKNLVAGLIFGFGVAVPVVVHSGVMKLTLIDIVDGYQRGLAVGSWFQGFLGGMIPLLLMCIEGVVGVLMHPMVLFMGLLFFLNITAIDLWESSRRTEDVDSKATHEATLAIGLIALVALVAFWAAFQADDWSRPFCYAVMMSAALLQLINRKRSKFSVDALRVLADLALLAPLPMLFFD